MKPLDPKWWLWVNLERLLFWRQLVSRCYCLEFRWIISAVTLTPGKETSGLPLYAQSSGHSQTDVQAWLWNVQSLLSSLLILGSGGCCASPCVCVVFICVFSPAGLKAQMTGIIKITQTCRAHRTPLTFKEICISLPVFSLFKRNLWHSLKLPVHEHHDWTQCVIIFFHLKFKNWTLEFEFQTYLWAHND